MHACSQEMVATQNIDDSVNRPLSPLPVKQEGKFYARQFSKAKGHKDDFNSPSSPRAPSFRVYYGVAPGSVPFVWESRPGTPKVTITPAELPPLTPPPSYFRPCSTRKANAKKKQRPTRFSFHLIATIIRRLTKLKWKPRTRRSLSSASSSLASSPFSRLGSWNSRQLGSSFSSRGEDVVEEEEDASSADDGSTTRSIFCFRVRRIPRTRLFVGRRS